MDIAALICRHIHDEQAPRPIRAVFHDADDGGFQFTCGDTDHLDDKAWRIVGQERIFRQHPELEGVRDLEEGYMATRTAPGQPWVIEALPPDPEEQAA